MKINLLAFSLLIISGVQVFAQMPTAFNFSSQINTDPRLIKSYGVADCLQSATALTPSTKLQAKLANGLGCSAIDPNIVGQGKNNALCTSSVVEGSQTTLGGIYSLEDGSFSVSSQEYLSLSIDPKGRIWYQVVFGKKGNSSGTFEIRGINKNEWNLAQVAGTSILDISTECKIDFPLQNTFQ